MDDMDDMDDREIGDIVDGGNNSDSDSVTDDLIGPAPARVWNDAPSVGTPHVR
jgi:hypothetical protein